MKNHEKQFCIGQVVDPEELFFRGEFIETLWKKLERQHLVLTAPRRTGKTSVMNHLFIRQKSGWLVLYLNVQDTSSPVRFYLQLMDEFNTRNPHVFSHLFTQGQSLIRAALNSVGSVEFQPFKIALRDSDAHLAEKWKDRLDDLLSKIRKNNLRILIILDEMPDMLLAMKRNDPALLREFLGWFRGQRQNPTPAHDSIRWMIGGSINLMATLDSMGLVDRMNDLEMVPLPVFSKPEVMAFVKTMLKEYECAFDESVPEEAADRLGWPILLFMQMATKDLFRTGRKTGRKLTREDVATVFNNLVISPESRDKLQHYYSRIAHYYEESTSIAYALLSMISLSPNGVSRRLLKQNYEAFQHDAAEKRSLDDDKRNFNELMLHLENDFYIIETAENQFDFASGVLKAWWRKYYA